MKKIIAVLLTLALMTGAFSVCTFAASDIEFSMKGATAVPGDTVEVDVYIDKNAGTWSAKFQVDFDDRYFTLLGVENGEVFNDSEFSSFSPIDDEGYYMYSAFGADPLVNNEKTGLILTLEFEVSKACPNGSHEIGITFPNDGNGWFFAVTEDPDDFIDRTVSCTEKAQIVVSGSDATAAPDEDEPTAKDEETTKPQQGVPVTEAVTDDEGKNVVDEDGKVVTEVVTDKDDNVIYFETDEKGDFVIDGDGNTVTFIEVKDDETTGADDTTSPDRVEDGDDEGGNENGNAKKIILFAAIGAVVVGAIIVIIVLAKTSKKTKIGDDE